MITTGQVASEQIVAIGDGGAELKNDARDWETTPLDLETVPADVGVVEQVGGSTALKDIFPGIASVAARTIRSFSVRRETVVP